MVHFNLKNYVSVSLNVNSPLNEIYLKYVCKFKTDLKIGGSLRLHNCPIEITKINRFGNRILIAKPNFSSNTPPFFKL